MGTLCLGKVSKEKMVKELVKGKKFANQLQVLLDDQYKKPFEEDGFVSAHELVVKILRSFTQALSVLSCDDEADQNLQQLQENYCNLNSDNGHRRSDDSGENSKKRPALKDKRGCYKRRNKSQTWTIVSSANEDSHAWRKYGQKQILNAKYPRSYFRCTHKYVQSCRAMKQVQRRDDDPQKYEITYIGNHTCRDIISFPQIVTENSDPIWGSSSVSTTASGVSSSSIIPREVIKQEYKEETTSTNNNDYQYQDLSSLDSIVWEDFVPFQSSDEHEAEAEAAAAAMVFSCNNKMIYSHHSLDMYNDYGFRFDDHCEFF